MSRFQDLVSAYHDHFTENPNACVNLGVDEHLGELPDPSLAATREFRKSWGFCAWQPRASAVLSFIEVQSTESRLPSRCGGCQTPLPP